ncbi:hypothetical protein FVE85_4764 [Porphyridium purpureum]|uniref:Uncharacterized protein n=1 Tax=Porphyridium purpureum TaxID=35688 RepID=A0A5J4YT52_PORPP|nr:hypothetical protein FVE85_4764 [Porphyridium purpureum]|eukprot:POR7189..scf236_6
MAAQTEHPEQNTRDRTPGTEHPGQNTRDRTPLTEHPRCPHCSEHCTFARAKRHNLQVYAVGVGEGGEGEGIFGHVGAGRGWREKRGESMDAELQKLEALAQKLRLETSLPHVVRAQMVADLDAEIAAKRRLWEDESAAGRDAQLSRTGGGGAPAGDAQPCRGPGEPAAVEEVPPADEKHPAATDTLTHTHGKAPEDARSTGPSEQQKQNEDKEPTRVRKSSAQDQESEAGYETGNDDEAPRHVPSPRNALGDENSARLKAHLAKLGDAELSALMHSIIHDADISRAVIVDMVAVLMAVCEERMLQEMSARDEPRTREPLAGSDEHAPESSSSGNSMVGSKWIGRQQANSSSLPFLVGQPHDSIEGAKLEQPGMDSHAAKGKPQQPFGIVRVSSDGELSGTRDRPRADTSGSKEKIEQLEQEIHAMIQVQKSSRLPAPVKEALKEEIGLKTELLWQERHRLAHGKALETNESESQNLRAIVQNEYLPATVKSIAQSELDKLQEAPSNQHSNQHSNHAETPLGRAADEHVGSLGATVDQTQKIFNQQHGASTDTNRSTISNESRTIAWTRSAALDDLAQGIQHLEERKAFLDESIRQSNVKIEELEKLSKTGEVSSSISSLLGESAPAPEKHINAVTFFRHLSSRPKRVKQQRETTNRMLGELSAAVDQSALESARCTTKIERANSLKAKLATCELADELEVLLEEHAKLMQSVKPHRPDRQRSSENR